jgi:23S rRNA (pseudouridine1915-N3)-methyltransferase
VRVTIIAVGRLRGGPEQALAEHYRERIAWPVDIREVEERRKLPPAELKRREAALIEAALPDRAVLVALDERGRELSSRDFAARIERWRDGGVADLAFAIGGADGLEEAIRSRARLVLSLGMMTWPHFMARGMLLEQLYRAQQILAGHPYHRD